MYNTAIDVTQKNASTDTHEGPAHTQNEIFFMKYSTIYKTSDERVSRIFDEKQTQKHVLYTSRARTPSTEYLYSLYQYLWKQWKQ